MESLVILGILGIWGVVHWVRNERDYQRWARQRDNARGESERQDSDH